VWRCILERIATLKEIETHWSIDDLMDANEALDVQQNAVEKQREEIERKTRYKGRP